MDDLHYPLRMVGQTGERGDISSMVSGSRALASQSIGKVTAVIVKSRSKLRVLKRTLVSLGHNWKKWKQTPSSVSWSSNHVLFSSVLTPIFKRRASTNLPHSSTGEMHHLNYSATNFHKDALLGPTSLDFDWYRRFHSKRAHLASPPKPTRIPLPSIKYLSALSCSHDRK